MHHGEPKPAFARIMPEVKVGAAVLTVSLVAYTLSARHGAWTYVPITAVLVSYFGAGWWRLRGEIRRRQR